MAGADYTGRDQRLKYLFRNGGGGGGGSSTLDGLSDVNLTTPTDGQTLVYNGTSGKWENASGGASGHTYSTTEQVVGTWIDGKPIYEISFSEVLNNMASGSQYQILDLTASAIENVLSISGGYWYETNNASDKRYVAQGQYCSLEYAYNGSILYGRQSFTGQTSNRKYTWIGTIQYTKTTD